MAIVHKINMEAEARYMILNWLMMPGGGAAGGGGGSWQMFALIGGMIVVMYFTMIRPQKKRQKEEQSMRENISIGDEITTIGGIMGRVITVKEDSIIIETGADRTKLRMVRSAVGVNNTAQEKIKAEQEAAKQAQMEARDAKMAESAKNRKKSKKNRDED